MNIGYLRNLQSFEIPTLFKTNSKRGSDQVRYTRRQNPFMKLEIKIVGNSANATHR